VIKCNKVYLLSIINGNHAEDKNNEYDVAFCGRNVQHSI